jgi:hypothetical protein
MTLILLADHHRIVLSGRLPLTCDTGPNVRFPPNADIGRLVPLVPLAATNVVADGTGGATCCRIPEKTATASDAFRD